MPELSKISKMKSAVWFFMVLIYWHIVIVVFMKCQYIIIALKYNDYLYVFIVFPALIARDPFGAPFFKVSLFYVQACLFH